MKRSAILRAAGAATACGSLATFAGGFVPPPDRTAPASVTTLTVTATSYGALSLTWTAVGDDGGGAGACPGAGTATGYDVRYSFSPPGGDIAAWFAGATPATGEPSPGACGSVQRLCLSGLTPGATYYIAMRVQDEARSISGVSNIACVCAPSGA